MITRIVVLEDDRADRNRTALAGTGRRFVSTVSTGSVRKSRARSSCPEDRQRRSGRTTSCCRSRQHTLLYRARRGDHRSALAVADVFARASTGLEALQAENARAPLEGEEAQRFKRFCRRPPMWRPFALRRLSAAADRQRRRAGQRHRRPLTSCSTRRRMR